MDSRWSDAKRGWHRWSFGVAAALGAVLICGGCGGGCSADDGAEAGGGGGHTDAGTGGGGGGDAAGHGGAPQSPAVLADYDREPREAEPRADGHHHVDSPALVERLVELNANTYAFLIYHDTTDWNDLQEYLPLAEAAGLETWVYLVPPSELPPDYPPYQDDYVAWAAAIGQLADQYPSLTGWAMDDFNSNTSLFTAQYTCQMAEAARAQRPDLRFYPVDYYPSVIADLAAPGYADCVDGVIFPYRDLDSNGELREQIEQIAALRELNGPWMQLSYPANSASAPAQYARYRAICNADDSGAKARFVYFDSYAGPTSGYHLARFVVNGQVLWSADTGGADPPAQVELDLASVAPAGSQAELAFELYEQLGVANYPVTLTYRDVVVEGCGAVSGDDWTYEESDSPFSGSLFEVAALPDLELIVMIYAAPTSWHSEPPTTQTIREGLEIGLQAWEDGLAQGVISYCLDKGPASADFAAVQSLYAQYAQQR